MRILWVMSVVAAGCGKGASSGEVESCNRMARLCGDEITAAELRECATDWPEFRKQVGEATAGKFAKCTREARSCPEVLGCATGIIGSLGKDFERGFEKMIEPDHKSDTTTTETDTTTGDGFDDDKPLPAQCKRADEVCAADEPFARDKCRDMVGNLKADAEHLKDLTDCYALAKNCFAFKKCSTDMWFKLN